MLLAFFVRRHAFLPAPCLIVASLLVTDDAVGPVPDRVRRELELASFYQKYVDVGGVPIVGSAKVSDFALREAAWIVRRMLVRRPDILEAMGKNRVRLVVMAWEEFTTDVPEHRSLEPKVYWDRRARGLGGSGRNPVVSCGEENLLCLPGDPYSKESILVHEFAHAIHANGLRILDPGFEDRLGAAYDSARRQGLWANTYAITNRAEYWAEGVQSWFDTNRQNDSLHGHVDTRAELEEYDPMLARLCGEVLGDNHWRYRKPMERSLEDRRHLEGFDPAKAPRFRWRQIPIPEKPRVLIQTAMGDIEVELSPKEAPGTVANFLKYVHEGFYGDGAFSRTVTLDNQPADRVKIQVVQARADPEKGKEFFNAIPLERTCDTGLRHLEGTLSMARSGLDTARDSFSICIGDQPELDFGGKRHPDGQGYAAFGMVVRGMDVVRKIHKADADGQKLTPPIHIQRAIRLN